MKNTILHVPHSSMIIPEEYKNLFLISASELKRELLKMTDMYTDDLFDDETKVVFPVSRLICDVERFRNEDLEPMAAKGMWICYEKTADLMPLKQVNKNHKEEILSKYYDSHHRRLANEVSDKLSKYETCTIIDAHSFPSKPLKYESYHEKERPDICIGADSFHTPEWLIKYTKDFFTKKGLTSTVNLPFSGSLVPMEYYQRNQRVFSIMIEVNRKLYMDETTGKKTEGYIRIKRILSEYLNHDLLQKNI